MKIRVLAILFLSCMPMAAFSAMHKEELVYHHNNVELTGYVFWDDSFTGLRPAVMVFHEWWGLNDYALLRAEMLAEEGYVAFAADMYGDGRRTRHAEDAKGWMQQITENVSTWQERATLGLRELLAHKRVDASKVAALGYCFGGATVMQLAYSGADLDGVISVHGSLPIASTDQVKKIKAKVLALHGASDGFVPQDQVDQFSKTLNDAGVNWEMDIYGGAKHSFSNPYADGYGIAGIEFNEEAEQASWNRTLAFLESLFANNTD